MTSAHLSIGRYLLSDILGEGGFATVYRAWDPTLQSDVALKALFPHLSRNEEVRRRFITEARAIAHLSHPNIVRFYDVGETDAQPFYTMEVVDGPTLATMLKAGTPLPPERVVELLRGLCSAIDYLHAAGLVHRDVKPSNIMIERSGRVVLMDFGIARMLDETQYTRTGASVGTPEYMSPEQALGEHAGPATDIYSLGIIAFQMLAGRLPFDGSTPIVLRNQAFDPPPPLSAYRPDLPASVHAVVDQCLAKAPAHRPPSAGAFLAALEAALLAPPRSTTPVHLTPPAPRAAVVDREAPGERAKRRYLFGGALAAAIVVLAVGGIGIKIATGGNATSIATPPVPTAAATLATTSVAPLVASATVSPSTATPAPPPSPSPRPTPKPAAQVLDAEILRPGAKLVQRLNLPAASGAPERILIYSDVPVAGGCRQPYVDLLAVDSSGSWSRTWDATQSPPGNPLASAVTNDGRGCFPAITQVAAQPLVQNGSPAAIITSASADGSRRIVVAGWDAASRRDTTMAEFQSTPNAQTTVADGSPLTIGVAEDAYPPPASGLNPQYSQPTGRLSLLLTWQGSALVTGSQHLTPNCAQGTLIAKAASGADTALLLSCPSGSPGPNSAALLNASTSIASGLTIADLSIGDDISLSFTDDSLAPSDPLNALAVAASASSISAFARKQPPRPAVTQLPRPPAPVVAPVQPAQPAIQPAAPPAVNSAPAPPPPAVPARATVPPQAPRVATVPPQTR